MNEPWPRIDLKALDSGVAPDADWYRDFCGAIVGAATARPVAQPQETTPIHCASSPDSEPCGGHIRLLTAIDESEIRWACNRCGLRGILVGWEGAGYDLSGVEWPDADWLEVELLASQYDALLGVGFTDPVARRILGTARGATVAVVLRCPREALAHLRDEMERAAEHARTAGDWELFDQVFRRIEGVLGPR